MNFEQLPKAVTDLQETVNDIKSLLIAASKHQQPPTDELLTVQDAAQFLNLRKPTIYSLISKGKLPFMKRSKRVYFSKLELMEYLKQGRKATMSEMNLEADNYLKNKKG